MTQGNLINGSFELTGAFFVCLSVRRALRDRVVRGVSWWTPVYFTAWGIWNLWYYPSLGQWFSFWGGVLLCAANAVWVVLVLGQRVLRELRRF